VPTPSALALSTQHSALSTQHSALSTQHSALTILGSFLAALRKFSHHIILVTLAAANNGVQIHAAPMLLYLA